MSGFFFLRRKATTPDIQRYLLCFALWGKADTPMGKNSSGSCVSNHYEILKCDSARHGRPPRGQRKPLAVLALCSICFANVAAAIIELDIHRDRKCVGTVPAVALALAMAPINSRSW